MVGNFLVVNSKMCEEDDISVLDWNLEESARKMKLDRKSFLQQDNDPQHTPRILTKNFHENKIKGLPRLARSPGMNTIKYSWTEVENIVKTKKPKNHTELISIFQDAWLKMASSVTMKLIECVLERIEAFIKA